MFLCHGLNTDGDLIPIHEVESGLTNLRCPFCGCKLLAKKGDINGHHFAHAGKTCSESKETITLTGIPFYDLNAGLSETEMAIIKKIEKYHSYKESWITDRQNNTFQALLLSGLVERRSDKIIILSKLGKELINYQNSNGHRTILAQCEIQERLIEARKVMLAYYDQHHNTKSSNFYNLRLATLLTQHLYIMHIRIEITGVCYPLIKIGMTRRSDINERINEIKRDLERHGSLIDIIVRDFAFHYGCLEPVILKMMKTIILK